MIQKTAACSAMLALLLTSSPVFADLSCIKVTSNRGKLSTSVKIVTTAKCPKGFTKVVDTSSLVGPAGATGASGADGQRLVYGNAGGGAKVVAATETLGADASPDNDTVLEFSSFTVNNGVVLTVPSGTVIRTTGAFINNGTITVETGASGANRSANSASALVPRLSGAHPGISLRAAGDSELGDNGATRTGGLGGAGLSEFQARLIRYPGSAAGGGGGNADNAATGASGGGSLVVIAQGAITNAGTINANGTTATGNAGGGGGGGVVILASKTSVTNSSTGVISASGGNGNDSDTDQGASGGGGGGIIHFIAPSVSNTGTAAVLAGTAGAAGAAGSVTATTLRGGGAGGGACGGSGGSGGPVSSVGDPTAAGTASAGHLLTTLLDPTASF